MRSSEENLGTIYVFSGKCHPRPHPSVIRRISGFSYVGLYCERNEFVATANIDLNRSDMIDNPAAAAANTRKNISKKEMHHQEQPYTLLIFYQ